jgi:zinc transport system permease protein
MLDPFLLKALFAGYGIALMTGPLGCFIAWQRLAYFGDTIAHAALLGVVMALLFQIDIIYGIIFIALALTLIVAKLQQEKHLASDTLLGIASHGALALGLVLLSLSSSISIDVNGLLFGDILAINTKDITLIYGLAVFVIAVLAVSWRSLMRLTLHADIARVEGVPTEKLRLTLMLIIALAVAASIKAVGILLVTSLLIIPAASVRYFSRTPTQMALYAVGAGLIAVTLGLYASLQFDTPSGPSIILAALAIFIGSYAASGRRRNA